MNVNTTPTSNPARTNMPEPPAAPMLEPTSAPILTTLQLPQASELPEFSALRSSPDTVIEPTTTPILTTLQLPQASELPETSRFRRSPNTVISLLSTQLGQAAAGVERVAISISDVLFLNINNKPVDTNKDSATGYD